MKVGDLVYDDYFGHGIVLKYPSAANGAEVVFYNFFNVPGRSIWIDKHTLLDVRVISESR